ncbi:SDR family NAD(P)-dependent oxidoreductase [Streptomyces sp. NPDC001513]|uniref:SDR family NAD(P)-dependent oxidoreductase n=1 Tax=Streptomyces sp. NPDC001513 TaxID=3364580 RepID=UPI0036B146C6
MSSFLSGRTIMVTGATSGIGYETARLLAECGATVLLHGRTAAEARAAVKQLLAHYLLTHLLEPALTTEPGGRVVNVSSSMHRTASIMWNDPNRTRRYSSLAAYAQSRLALTVFAADPRVTAVSVNPGVCETALRPLYGHEGATPAEGATHIVRLCDPAVEIVNGAYYDRGERMEPAAGATEERTVKRLNKLADQLVGHSV